MSFLSLFKRRNKSTVEESFVKSEVIYNRFDSFYILISFSKDKLNEAVEFMSDIAKVSSNVDDMYAVYRHSSYEEETDRKDDKGYSIINVYDRHYIFMGGTDISFRNLIKRSDNLANEIMVSIMADIANNRPSEEYKDLINDNIFASEFVYDTPKRSSIKFDIENNVIHMPNNEIFYDNISAIKSKLPKCFTMQCIIGVVMATNSNNYRVTIKQELSMMRQMIVEDNLCTIEDFLSSWSVLLDIIIPVRTPEDIITRIEVLTGPQYMMPDQDDEDGVSDAEIDEIFKEKYEKFVGVADDNIEYEDIDEELSKEPIFDEGDDNNG